MFVYHIPSHIVTVSAGIDFMLACVITNAAHAPTYFISITPSV